MLKKFNNIIVLIDDLLIWNFLDSLKPLIYASLEKKNRKLDNWQVIVKQVGDTKAKVVCQAPLLAWKNNAPCS